MKGRRSVSGQVAIPSPLPLFFANERERFPISHDGVRGLIGQRVTTPGQLIDEDRFSADVIGVVLEEPDEVGDRRRIGAGDDFLQLTEKQTIG